MYGMKQKNINKKAKITTITISATIPSQQEIKVEKNIHIEVQSLSELMFLPPSISVSSLVSCMAAAGGWRLVTEVRSRMRGQ